MRSGLGLLQHLLAGLGVGAEVDIIGYLTSRYILACALYCNRFSD